MSIIYAFNHSISTLILVLTFLVLTNQAVYNFQQAQYWGSYQFKVYYANGTTMDGTTLMTDYIVTFPTTVSNILDISVVLSSYQLANLDGLMYKINKPTFTNSTSNTSFGIQIIAPSSFVFIKFFVVYNTQLSSTFFQINIADHICTVVNGTNNTPKTQTITSTMRLSVNGSTMNIKPVLTSILMLSNNGSMDFNFGSATASGNTLSITLNTNTIIIQIIITTFILKSDLIPDINIFYIDNLIQLNRTPGNISSLCTNNFNIPSYYGPIYDQKCALAVNYLLDQNTGVLRKIDIDATTSNFTCSNSAQNATNGTMTIGFTAFCSYVAVCTNSSEYYLPTNNTNITNYTCYPCTNHHSSCLTCNSTFCYTCNIGFYPLNNGTNGSCATCNQTNCTQCLTINTCGACTNYSYLSNNTCLSCTIMSNCIICSNNNTCLSCLTGYAPNSTALCQNCSILIPNCALCNDRNNCTQCQAAFYLASDNYTCASCLFSCTACLNSTNCTSCITAYYLYNFTCLACNARVSLCIACDANLTCSQCTPGYSILNTSGTITCVPCSIQGCFVCVTSNNCTSCLSYYYLNTNFTCTACSDPNCINCTASICYQCSSEFMLAPNNINCICNTGYWPVTSLCMNVIGCTTAVKINNISTCIFCNNLLNFIISGSNCLCQTGYKLSKGQCIIYCGDGILISPQQCDDGNTIDGDGCSSICNLQPNFKCGNNNGTYKCVYTGYFTTSLQYIWRQQQDNSCTYYFSISPTNPNFIKMNLPNSTKLTLPSNNYQINSISYNQGTIAIDVSFTADIQNLIGTLSIGFDPTYFNTTNTTYSFLSTGTNQALVVSSHASQVKYLKIFSYIIVGLAFLILLFSIYYQKMIGIQTINILQLFLFTKLLYVQKDLLLSSQILNLRYITGYNDIGKNLQRTHQVPTSYRRLNFNSDFILNFQTGFGLILLSILIYILLLLHKKWSSKKISKHRKGNIDQQKLSDKKYQQRQKFIYQRIFYVIACISLFNCIAAIRVQSRILIQQRQYVYFLLNLITLIISVGYIFSILTYQVINIGKQHKFQAPFCSYSEYYIGYYTLYIILIVPILIGGEQFANGQALYIMGGYQFINFIILIIWKPYKQFFHNFAIIFNNLVYILLLSISIYMKIVNLDQTIQSIFAYTFLGLMFIVQLLAAIRLFIACKTVPKEIQKLNKGKAAEQQFKKGFEIAQKQFLNDTQKRLAPQTRSKMKGTDDDQQLRKLRNRLKKEFKARNDQIEYQI